MTNKTENESLSLFSRSALTVITLVLFIGGMGAAVYFGSRAEENKNKEEQKRNSQRALQQADEYGRLLEKRAKMLEDSNAEITGTVLEEKYENLLSKVPQYRSEKESSYSHVLGLLNGEFKSEAFSNETVKIDAKYSLRIKKDDGEIIAVAVVDGAGGKTKEALETLITEGARVSFPRGTISYITEITANKSYGNGYWISGGEIGNLPEETWFKDDTQIGTKRADRIRILKQ